MEEEAPQSVDDAPSEESPSTQCTESGQATDHGCPSNMSGGELEAPTNARAPFAGDALQRMVGLRGRVLVSQRGVETIRVHVPRDLDVVDQRRCSIELKVAVNQGATATGALEDTRHLNVWETFTSALLTIHRCIVNLTLHISAVKRVPRHFYQSFSLRNGVAQINVEVSAFPNPFRDFLVPFISTVRRLQNYQLAGIRVNHISAQDRDNLPQEMFLEDILMLGHLQLNDNRLAPILEAAADMPFLNQLGIHLHNTGAASGGLRDVGLALTRRSSGEHRRLRCEVDPKFANLLDCACGNQLDTGELLRLLACRELTGLESAMAKYLLKVTRPIDPVNNVLNVNITVRARNEDEGR